MILSRVLLHPQERYNLEDFDQEQIDILTDSKYWTNQFLSGSSYILKGFQVSGAGAPSPCTVTMANATLINANSTGEFSWYSAPAGAAPITVNLQTNQRNYLELQLSTVDGTPLTRAFWDPSANGGTGAEFNQTVNTTTDIQVTVVVNTSAFTGSPDRIPLAIIDTNLLNNMKVILDKRPMFFRLGQPGSPLGSYSWSSQNEPSAFITLSGTSGTFAFGETLTFQGGATAVCTSGGSSSIQANLFTSDIFGSTVTGATSGATGTVVTIQDAFTGADKDIGNFRDALAAIMSEIKAIKGTKEWFNNANASISGLARFIDSCIVESPTAVTQAVIQWTGSALRITDSNGSPSSSDIISIIRLLGSSQILNMYRSDGQVGTPNITINDGQVLFVQIPSNGTNANFQGTGSSGSNYQVVDRSSFIPNDTNYWLAYREGSKIIFRGMGELQAGEVAPIGDTIPVGLLNAIGLADEVSPPSYSSNIRGSSNESLVSRVGTLTDQIGNEQEDRSMFFKSDSPIVWTGSQIIFDSPIVLECLNGKTGGSYTNTIPTTFSPINLNNGDSIYFNLNRGNFTVSSLINSSSTPIPAQSQANRDIIVLAKREDVSTGNQGEESDVFNQQLLYIPLHKQTIRNGRACYLGEAGSGRNSIIRVDYHDPISTTLPTGATVVIDANAGVTGDLVLFSNLGFGNNRIYRLSGVGTSITWTPQYDFYTGLDPIDGEMVIVGEGQGFADQVGKFTGNAWEFNKTIRLFNGPDFWELGSIITVALANNTTGTIFSVGLAGSQNWNMPYSLTRGLVKESGILLMTTDGSTVSVTKTGPALGSSGVSFSGSVVSGNIVLNYTSDNSGASGTVKLFTMRWSDSAGGPTGIPNYTAGSGSSVTAAGNTGDIQYKAAGGGLDADDRFKFDASKGAMLLGTLEVLALSGPVTILDNQASFQTLFSYNASTYKRAVIEYSITRNGEERTGRMLVSNNGVIAGQSDDFVETNQIQPTGVVLQAIYSGGNILVQYTSDSQGAGGQFFYSMRRW